MHKVLSILDTGAQDTIVSTKLMKKLGLFYAIDTNTSDKARGIGGITDIYGYLRDSIMSIGEVSILVSLAVVQDNSFDMLLGRDILFGKFKKLILNSGEQALTFDYENKSYKIYYTTKKTYPSTSRVYFSELLYDYKLEDLSRKVSKELPGYPIKQ